MSFPLGIFQPQHKCYSDFSCFCAQVFFHTDVCICQFFGILKDCHSLSKVVNFINLGLLSVAVSSLTT